MSVKGSLWSKLATSTRAELVPIISTAVLVQAGEATADALVRLSHLTLLHDEPNSTAVTDVTGMLLLLNFPVVLWFAYSALKESLQAGTALKLDSKLVGLSTAFLTSADLLSYGVKSHHLDRTLYALLVLLFVFAVPFFLIKKLPASAPAEQQSGDVEQHTLGAMALVVIAVVPAIAAVLATTLFEVALNDIGAPGHSFVAGVLGQSGRTEFWGVSPGVVGITWLPLILCTYLWVHTGPTSMRLGLDRSGMAILALASAGVFALLAVVLIDDHTLLLSTAPAAVAPWLVVILKIGLVYIVAILFALSYLAAQLIARRQLPWLLMLLASLALFAAAGALVGGYLVMLRSTFAHQSPQSLALVVLHACGFVIAYFTGWLTLSFLRRREFTDITPRIR